jgi:hypothetical protein
MLCLTLQAANGSFTFFSLRILNRWMDVFWQKFSSEIVEEFSFSLVIGKSLRAGQNFDTVGAT